MNHEILHCVIAALYRRAGSVPARAQTIYNDVCLESEEAVTLEDVTEHINHAVEKGWVDYSVRQTDRERLYYLTPEGKIAWRENFR